MTNVVICGSLAYPELLEQCAAELRAAGMEVIVPERDDSVSEEQHAEVWRKHILGADRVMVVLRPDRTLGEGTAGEVAWALGNGVPVSYWVAQAGAR